MAIGDLNKKFGWIWLLIAPLLGILITAMLNSRGAEYSSVMREVTIAGQNLTLYMGEAFPRVANRLLHVHSGLLAFLNILYGLSIDNVPLTEKTKRLGSILAIAGAVLVTFGFYSIQVMSLSSLGFPLRVLGGISIVVAVLILAVGEIKKK